MASFALGLGLVVPACAHAPAASPSSPEALTADDSTASVRRENAALKRRVQMLEDRVLRVERQAMGEAAAPVAQRSLRPRAGDAHIPAYEVESQTAGAGPEAAATASDGVDSVGEIEHDELADTRLWDDPTGLAQTGEPEPAEVADEGGSYRLVGDELVQMTEPQQPKPADKPARGRKGRSIKAQYDNALALLRAGDHDAATTAFADFVAAHPRSDLADNALYWQGESAYDQGHYADALASFTAVIERYAGGNKASDALLKIGLCYAKLGDLDNARDVLNRLIEAYPGASASDVARVKLAELPS